MYIFFDYIKIVLLRGVIFISLKRITYDKESNLFVWNKPVDAWAPDKAAVDTYIVGVDHGESRSLGVCVHQISLNLSLLWVALK